MKIYSPKCSVRHQTPGQEDKRFQVHLLALKSQQVGESCGSGFMMSAVSSRLDAANAQRGGSVIQDHGRPFFFSDSDPSAVHREPRPVHAPPASGLAGGPADEGSGQRREGQKAGERMGRPFSKKGNKGPLGPAARLL